MKFIVDIIQCVIVNIAILVIEVVDIIIKGFTNTIVQWYLSFDYWCKDTDVTKGEAISFGCTILISIGCLLALIAMFNGHRFEFPIDIH